MGQETKIKTQNNMVKEEKYIVMPLLAVALAANLFLFAVAYTNSSFQTAQSNIPDVTRVSMMSAVNNTLDAAGKDLRNSYALVWNTTKPALVAFAGLENYKFGVPIKTSIAPRAYTPAQPQAVAQISTAPEKGQVLGIMIINPTYANLR
ncbi:hypothetical protein KGQ24_00130 [Patescibacteria group bacterium]|nr:hypothetical protein [Patescibacteria group bacterium]